MVTRFLGFLFALACLFLIGSLLRADDDVPLYSPFSQVQEKKAPVTPKKKEASSLEVATGEAMKKKVPLVVFVGTSPRQVPGCVVVRDDTWQEKTCVTVHTFDGSGYGILLPASADDRTIRAAAGLEVSPPAVPFVKPSARSTADGRPHARQLPSWFPKDAERYVPARHTQQVFNRTVTQAVPRSHLEAKWNVPGGLEGISGWKSDLYRSVPGQASVWRGDIEVWAGNYWQWGNGSVVYEGGVPKKAYQTEMAWQRSYPVGSWFADVLSKDGGVFEVRVREKREAGWESYVAYRDPKYRPDGYVVLPSRSCNECHSQAGSGGYAVGWVPGGDGVISDPFDGLES